MVDDQIGQIHSSCPGSEQAQVHIGIFIGEEVRSLWAQVGGIESNPA